MTSVSVLQHLLGDYIFPYVQRWMNLELGLESFSVSLCLASYCSFSLGDHVKRLLVLHTYLFSFPNCCINF